MNAERPNEAIDDTQEETPEVEAGADVAEEAVEPADELAAAQAKADENWERYVRAAAELENVRKRASRDVANAHKYALERFGKELLAVKDTLEMGLAVEDATAESLLEGSNATLKLLGTTLERFGIVEVDPAGEPFDPELHEAISMLPSDNVEPGSVVDVVQKGYTLNGRLLRPAMVIVASE
ncbi:MAG: nucleotide exchange factor GrpE [Gammaproteobacteria bacterium]|jgi:molecular chaperone GrpE|nr:nucleotide exchange factor GrpE [Gammaproteobacteria bacterium]MDH3954302.1 nucleotide exchange factor GrpE [Gammaproteobacteria bacterium]